MPESSPPSDSEPQGAPADPADRSPAWHPQRDGRLRWWDGEKWTDNFHGPIAAPEDASDVAQTSPPAWHKQPDGRLRWWDGEKWTDHYHVSAASEQKNGFPPPKSNSGGAIGCLAVVAAIIGGVYLYGLNNQDRDPVYDEVSAYTYCQIEVRDQLKAPSSARFSNMSATGSGGDWVARGEVEAENSFGVMMRSDFQCTLRNGREVRVDFIR